MGGFTPWLSTALGVAGLVSRMSQNDKTYRNKRQSLEQSTQLEKREKQMRRTVDENQRQRQLGKDRARMQAFLASRGLDSRRGSARAVMLGLTEESKQKGGDRDALNRLGLDRIDNRYRKNLLDLKDRRRRQKTTTLQGGLEDIIGKRSDNRWLPDIFSPGPWRRRSLL